MFITSWYYALIAILIAVAIYKYIEYKGLVSSAVSYFIMLLLFKNFNWYNNLETAGYQSVQISASRILNCLAIV